MSIDLRWLARVAFALLVFAGFCAVPMRAQLSMGRPGFTPIPPPRKKAAAPSNQISLTGDEQKRLAAMIQKMPAKQRKKLNKALQKMTPQQRQQFLALVKKQLGSAQQSVRRTK